MRLDSNNAKAVSMQFINTFSFPIHLNSINTFLTHNFNYVSTHSPSPGASAREMKLHDPDFFNSDAQDIYGLLAPGG